MKIEKLSRIELKSKLLKIEEAELMEDSEDDMKDQESLLNALEGSSGANGGGPSLLSGGSN